MNRLFTLKIKNGIIDYNYEYNLGHTFGQGQLSPDCMYNFIHISKNGSSFAKDFSNNWNHSNYFKIKKKVEHIVILRDPTDRWLSGISEFLVGKYSFVGNAANDVSEKDVELLLDNELFKTILFNFVIFDGHTIPQCCYLRGVNLEDCSFFYHNDYVFEKIANHVGIKSPMLYKKINSTQENTRKKIIIKKLKEMLLNSSELQHKIDKHYYADHQLFDAVRVR